MTSQVYKAVEILGAGPELLAIIGSWGDSLSDADVLECLAQWVEHGTCKSRILFQVGDTPADRRARFMDVKAQSTIDQIG